MFVFRRKSVTSLKSNKAMFVPDTFDTSQVAKASAAPPVPVKTPEPKPTYDEDGEFSPHNFMVWFNTLRFHLLL